MLELVNITKTFNLTGNKEDTMVALNNVTLRIKPGEFVTIIGSNGSGKSTTMNIITGTLFPDSGKVLLNGEDITREPEHVRAQYFGRVFQDPCQGTSTDMSVLENLEIAFRRGAKHSPFKWGFSKKNKEYFIHELKRFGLGLENRLNQKVGSMSGGQRQALTLLMATMSTKPTHKAILRDYVRFTEGDKEQAKKEVHEAYEQFKKQYNDEVKEIKNSNLYPKEKREAIQEAYDKYDKEFRKFDLTKQILLLDEHTAALDPKTAKKVLELTDLIVKENGLTTIMITHNMKDALTYGDRLIMFHSGHIIHDFSKEEKDKLSPEDLLKLFDEADALLGD